MKARSTIWLMLCAVIFLPFASGQGLLNGPGNLGASAAARAAMEQAYLRAAKWQKFYPKNRRAACSSSRTSLCGLILGASAEASEALTTLQLATAPAQYDVRSYPYPVTPRLNQAFDQKVCSLCVAAAVAAAAEAAVASVLMVPASQVQLSRSFLYYCSKYSSGNTCTSGWQVEQALNALKEQLVPSLQCSPNKGLSIFDNTQQEVICPKKPCPDTLAAQGTFTWRKISNFWEAQDHIRMYGAVISRMALYMDDQTEVYHLKEFYKQNPATTPYNLTGMPKGSGADWHAVLLVGYDNDKEQWLVLNSWGVQFAQQGAYWNPFGVSQIASEMWGIEWTPNEAPRDFVHSRTRPSSKPGCFWYKAQTGDYVYLIAKHYFGVDLNKFLLDNLDRIGQVNEPLPSGLEVLVCGGTSLEAIMASTSNSSASKFAAARPYIGANPAIGNTAYVQNNPDVLTMFKTLQPFDGRSLYLLHGPISKICTWKPQHGSLSMIQVTYGQHATTANGEQPENVRMVPDCVTFGAQERIIQVDTISGLLVDGLRFQTTDKSRSNNWPTLLARWDAGKEEDLPWKILKAPPGGFLAAISGYTAKYNYYIPGGATADMVAGLQFDWAISN